MFAGFFYYTFLYNIYKIITAFTFKIIGGLYFINKLQKIVGNIRCFLFKKSLLRIAPFLLGRGNGS